MAPCTAVYHTRGECRVLLLLSVLDEKRAGLCGVCH